MNLIKGKSKYDSKCPFEHDGVKCGADIKVGADYLWETENRKAYCMKHESLNSQAKDPAKSPGGKGYQAPATFRTPEDGANATGLFINILKQVPTIRTGLFGDQEDLKVKANQSVYVVDTLKEIFLGKTQAQGGKTS